MSIQADPERAGGGALKRWRERYISLYVDRPILCCGGCCCVLLLLTLLSIALGCMNIADQREGAWNILDAENTQTFMALNLARDAATTDDPAKLGSMVANRRLSLPGVEQHDELSASAGGYLSSSLFGSRRLWSPGRRLEESEKRSETLLIFYKSDKAGQETVFTPKRLREICLLERHWLSTAEVLQITLFDSVVGLFYGIGAEPKSRVMNTTAPTWECQELSQASVDATVAAIRADVMQNGARSSYGRFIHPDFVATGRSFVSRTYIAMQVEDDKKDQIPIVVLEYLGRRNGFFQDGLFHSSAYMGEEDRFIQNGDIRIRVVSSATDEFATMVQPDFLLAILSVFLVWVVLWSYMGSFFLGSVSMFQIIVSMPVGALIYKVLGIDYFEFLHILVIYLVLGIGADDVFVLLDTFRHLADTDAPLEEDGRYPRDTLFKIVEKTWMRTASAIFNTSFTTAMAFVSCSGSKAMPMRTCGWYAAITIILNYVFTITFTPAVMVIWHKYIQGKRCCCPQLTLRPEGKMAVDGAKREEKKLFLGGMGGQLFWEASEGTVVGNRKGRAQKPDKDFVKHIVMKHIKCKPGHAKSTSNLRRSSSRRETRTTTSSLNDGLAVKSSNTST